MCGLLAMLLRKEGQEVTVRGSGRGTGRQREGSGEVTQKALALRALGKAR